MVTVKAPQKPNNYGLKIHRLKAVTESHWKVL
jgi:hypothetical protein